MTILSSKKNAERITITLPARILEEVDRIDTNRSRFVLQAVRGELARRRREGLLRSLAAPHPEASEIAEEGFDDWVERLPEEDAAGLVDPGAGTTIRWLPGEGWRETDE